MIDNSDDLYLVAVVTVVGKQRSWPAEQWGYLTGDTLVK